MEFKNKTPREIKAYIASCDEKISNIEAELLEKERHQGSKHNEIKQYTQTKIDLQAKIDQHNIIIEA